MISRQLAQLEDSFLRFWLTLNNVISQIETATYARILVPVLRQELGHAMQKFYYWRKAMWMQKEQLAFLEIEPFTRKEIL